GSTGECIGEGALRETVSCLLPCPMLGSAHQPTEGELMKEIAERVIAGFRRAIPPVHPLPKCAAQIPPAASGKRIHFLATASCRVRPGKAVEMVVWQLVSPCK